MKLRKSQSQDIPAIMRIVKDAQELLASLNIDQWQDGYPNIPRFELDIDNDESFLLIENEEIVATTMFTLGGEPTYNNIDGKWITNESAKYGVIHRMAVRADQRGKGHAKWLMKHFEDQLKVLEFDSMRIDTHRDNKGMQAMLKGLGYTYCGVIILESGSERLAFEKVFS